MSRVFWAVALGLMPTVMACGEDPKPSWPTSSTQMQSSAESAASAPPSPNSRRANATAPSASAVDEEPPPRIEFQESDFSESESSRDPFRSYGDLFAEDARAEVRTKRQVLLEEYSLDELKLVAVVTKIQPARAMLVDPTGKGHVVKRSQLVGRSERVQGVGAETTYHVHWQVDRIRDSDVVFVREDPSNPDVPMATRVLSLHDQENR